MDGEMWVESKPGHGSTFSFTVTLRRGSGEQKRLLAEDVNWSNIRIFAVDDDPEIREFFMNVAENLNIACEVAASGEEAVTMLSGGDQFDLYFLDWNLPGMNGIELARIINAKSDQNPIVIIFSSIDWSYIEDDAHAAGVDKFLPKPLFQSSIVDLINDCINWDKAPASDERDNTNDDFSGHTILLAEDVEINREIFMTLLEPTRLTIEYAEDGAQALDMFTAAPDKYEIIFMDVQMPEMDGYEATRRIRALNTQRSKDIPIVAITANVFTEDRERCIEAGMNNHVGKPLDINEVLTELRKYLIPSSCNQAGLV
jgi:CheY-like chemotaxis protein